MFAERGAEFRDGNARHNGNHRPRLNHGCDFGKYRGRNLRLDGKHKILAGSCDFLVVGGHGDAVLRHNGEFFAVAVADDYAARREQSAAQHSAEYGGCHIACAYDAESEFLFHIISVSFDYARHSCYNKRAI